MDQLTGELPMLRSNKDRVCVLIDGSNLYATTRLLRFEPDYKLFLKPFEKYGKIVFANYYTAEDEDESSGNIKIRPIVDWLAYNGYQTVTKETRTFTDSSGNRRIKGNMDTEITTDMLLAAYEANIDTVVLVSGDGDFSYVVRAVQRRGVRVVVVSSKDTSPSMVADTLRRTANEFIELNELKDIVRRRDG